VSSSPLVASRDVPRGEKPARAAASRAGGSSRGVTRRTSGVEEVPPATDVTVPRVKTLVGDDRLRGEASLEHVSGAPSHGVGPRGGGGGGRGRHHRVHATTMSSLVAGASGWTTPMSPRTQWSARTQSFST
jgi:hypothetical protein